MLSSTKLLTAAIQKQGRPFPAPTLHRVRLLLQRANNRSPQPTLLQHPHQQHPHPARAERLGHHHFLSKNQRAPHCCSAGEPIRYSLATCIVVAPLTKAAFRKSLEIHRVRQGQQQNDRRTRVHSLLQEGTRQQQAPQSRHQVHAGESKRRIKSFNGDKSFTDALTSYNFEKYKYAIVMPKADRNLDAVFRSERPNQPHRDKVSHVPDR